MQGSSSLGLRAPFALLITFLLGCSAPSHADAGSDSSVTRRDTGLIADSGSADATSIETACAARPEDCEQLGLFFGACDGPRDPVMACNDQGRCFWYTGGCPVGMQASDCPPDDICCHETPDGRWPFAEWEPPSSGTATGTIEMINDVAAIGAAPIDALAPNEIAVTIDPTVEAPADGEPYVRCSPGGPLLVACTEWSIVPPRRVGIALVVALRPRRQGLQLHLEIVDSEPGPVGRVFMRYQEDASPDTVPATCAPLQPRFTSGTLRLSALDESAHGRLRAELADGDWIELDF
jgi:hypothetical protein